MIRRASIFLHFSTLCILLIWLLGLDNDCKDLCHSAHRWHWLGSRAELTARWPSATLGRGTSLDQPQPQVCNNFGEYFYNLWHWIMAMTIDIYCSINIVFDACNPCEMTGPSLVSVSTPPPQPPPTVTGSWSSLCWPGLRFNCFPSNHMRWDIIPRPPGPSK